MLFVYQLLGTERVLVGDRRAADLVDRRVLDAKMGARFLGHRSMVERLTDIVNTPTVALVIAMILPPNYAKAWGEGP